jgi:hypothetical protein
MTLLSRQVFSAQGRPRKKLKICPEFPGKSFLNIYLNILYVVCSPNGNGKVLSPQFLENDESVFHLAAMSQYEQGSEGHVD